MVSTSESVAMAGERKPNSNRGMEISGLSTDLAMVMAFRNRYRSWMFTWDSKTLKGKDRAALTVMIRRSLAPRASSSGAHLVPNTIWGWAARKKPRASSTSPSSDSVTRNIPLSFAISRRSLATLAWE